MTQPNQSNNLNINNYKSTQHIHPSTENAPRVIPQQQSSQTLSHPIPHHKLAFTKSCPASPSSNQYDKITDDNLFSDNDDNEDDDDEENVNQGLNENDQNDQKDYHDEDEDGEEYDDDEFDGRKFLSDSEDDDYDFIDESSVNEDPKQKKKHFLRYFLLFLLFLSIAITIWVYFRKLQSLVNKILAHRFGGYFLLLLTFCSQSLLGLPTLPLTLAGGYSYGVVLGSFLMTVCSITAASLGFVIARFMFRDYFRKKFIDTPTSPSSSSSSTATSSSRSLLGSTKRNAAKTRHKRRKLSLLSRTNATSTSANFSKHHNCLYINDSTHPHLHSHLRGSKQLGLSEHFIDTSGRDIGGPKQRNRHSRVIDQYDLTLPDDIEPLPLSSLDLLLQYDFNDEKTTQEHHFPQTSFHHDSIDIPNHNMNLSHHNQSSQLFQTDNHTPHLDLNPTASKHSHHTGKKNINLSPHSTLALLNVSSEPFHQHQHQHETRIQINTTPIYHENVDNFDSDSNNSYNSSITLDTDTTTLSSTITSPATSDSATTINSSITNVSTSSTTMAKPSFLQQIDNVITDDGFTLVFLLRFSPIHPSGIFNYLFGITSVGFWQYFFGTFFAMLPTTIMEVYLGTALKSVGEIIGVTKETRPLAPHLFPEDAQTLHPNRTLNGADTIHGSDSITNTLPIEASKESREALVFWAGLIFTLLSALVLTLYVKRKLNLKIEELESKRMKKIQLEEDKLHQRQLQRIAQRKKNKKIPLQHSASTRHSTHLLSPLSHNDTSNTTIFTTNNSNSPNKQSNQNQNLLVSTLQTQHPTPLSSTDDTNCGLESLA